MNTRFHFLQRLDDDLHEAAVREIAGHGGGAVVVADRSEARSGGDPVPDLASRRPPRRERRWRGLVAAGVSLLVVAGGIGFIVQNGGVGTRAAKDATSVIGIGRRAEASATAEVPAAPGLGQVAPVTGQASGNLSRRSSLNGDAGVPAVPATSPGPATQGSFGTEASGSRWATARSARRWPD
jgi:hypothetical protein